MVHNLPVSIFQSRQHLLSLPSAFSKRKYHTICFLQKRLFIPSRVVPPVFPIITEFIPLSYPQSAIYIRGKSTGTFLTVLKLFSFPLFTFFSKGFFFAVFFFFFSYLEMYCSQFILNGLLTNTVRGKTVHCVV